MKLKKCPICEMPNDENAKECIECSHSFDSDSHIFTKEERLLNYKKERKSYQSILERQKLEEKQIDFYSISHLFGFYIINLIALLIVIFFINKTDITLDLFIFNKLASWKIMVKDYPTYAKFIFGLKFAVPVIFTQFFLNIIIIKRLNREAVIIVYYLSLLIGMATFLLMYKILQ